MGKRHTNNFTGKLKSVLLLSVISLLVLISVSWGAQQEDATKSMCAFSKYLEDADSRDRYENMLSRGRFRYTPMNNHENAALFFVIAKSGYGVEHVKNLDTFSAGCLACHDGKSASKVRPSIINSPNKKDVKTSISTKHPIGMDYEKYSALNKSLKSLDEMSQNLNLTDGRVGCLTCHDPLNSERNHLRITKTGIDLCSACHKM